MHKALVPTKDKGLCIMVVSYRSCCACTSSSVMRWSNESVSDFNKDDPSLGTIHTAYNNKLYRYCMACKQVGTKK